MKIDNEIIKDAIDVFNKTGKMPKIEICIQTGKARLVEQVTP
jgi:hypothetical protein